MAMPFDFESPWLLTSALVVVALLFVLRYTLVDSPRVQTALSALVRIVVVLLIVLAIAQTLWMDRSTAPAVVVLADLSDSAPEDAAEQTKRYLDDLSEQLHNPGQAGLVVFAEGAQLATPVSVSPEFPEELEPPEDTTETSIARALQLASEAMPSGHVPRIVLLSDGNETDGAALDVSKRCATRGTRIYTVPYDVEEKDEVLLEDLIVPAEAKRGQTFTITAVVHITKATKGDFVLYRNGFKMAEKSMDLEEGETSLVFDETGAPDGLTKYELRVRADDDFFADNNVAAGTVHVAGEPRVLLLEGEEREARYLSRALEAENIRVEVRESRGMPGTLDELAAFDAVIFSDVPATHVSVGQMNALRSYIEDLGGGFIMLGGEESFGLGGYYRTSIEDALPVRMKSEKKTDTPSLAMMLIVDKSGSMGGEKIELAKEAAIATVELLGDRDYIGVVAFDGAAYWVCELQNASNKGGIMADIESIAAGGGTSIYPAMEEAYAALSSVPAALKHAVLLTDGHSSPGDFEGITNQMVNELITVSTVGVGDGADGTLLQDIARWGRGRYYFTADPYDIPQIFTKETMSASKSSLVEEPFLPQVMRQHPMIQSVDWEDAPFLFGYIVTTPKATAEVPLITERGEPLLVTWRFGLGKTVAFTSDAKSRWASDWLNWPGYGRFWSQVVRSIMRTSDSRGNQTLIETSGAKGRIVVDTVNESGGFVNTLTTTAQLIDPQFDVYDLELKQTAPGRYESEFDLDDTGSYMFKVRQTVPGAGDDAVYADFTRGLTVSYKPEYRHLATNRDFLEELAEVTGGAYNATIDDVLNVGPDEAVPVRRRLWPPLLLAAVLIFVLDVALRRLDLAGWKIGGSPQRYG